MRAIEQGSQGGQWEITSNPELSVPEGRLSPAWGYPTQNEGAPDLNQPQMLLLDPKLFDIPFLSKWKYKIEFREPY